MTSPTVKVVPDATERPPLTENSIPGGKQTVRQIVWNNGSESCEIGNRVRSRSLESEYGGKNRISFL